MRVRRLGGGIALLLAALLLSACASLPTSGPVTTSAPQAVGGDAPAVFQPNGPTDGMSPSDVVKGFVLAESAGGGYVVAKQFLTSDFARTWRPDAAVWIHTDPWTLSGSGDRVRISVPEVARVDATGVFTPTGATQAKDYRLEQVRGQWRISGGPNGVVLTEQAFQSVFTPVQLQFFDPSWTRLVPDRRWFPTSGNRAEQVVAAMISGQAPLLRAITEPAFPAGTALSGPVRSSEGVTTVAVTVPGGLPAERVTDRIQRAVAATLPVSTASLRLVVDGRQAPIASAAVLDQPSIADPVVAAGGRFGSLSAQGTVREDATMGPRITALDPRAVTVSTLQRLAAVLTGKGQVDVLGASGRPRVVDQRAGLIAPTLDQLHWTWSVPADDPAGLRATSPAGRSVTVSGLRLTAVKAIQASTDGTRLLVLGSTASRPVAFVAGILRDSDGTPTALTPEQYPVQLGGVEVLDATWVDQGSVAVLTRTGSIQNVLSQQLGGLSTPIGVLTDVESIVGGTRLADLRGRVGSGALVQYGATYWRQESPVSLRISVLAVQR